jgi:hypothetical protein
VTSFEHIRSLIHRPNSVVPWDFQASCGPGGRPDDDRAGSHGHGRDPFHAPRRWRQSQPGRARRRGCRFLGLLTDATRGRLLERSQQVVYRAGTVAFSADDPGRAFVLNKRLARVYWTVPDGREGDCRLHPPRESAWRQEFGPRHSGDEGPRRLVSVQAVVDSRLTLLDLETVRRPASSEIEVVTAIATYLAARVCATTSG